MASQVIDHINTIDDPAHLLNVLDMNMDESKPVTVLLSQPSQIRLASWSGKVVELNYLMACAEEMIS